jgi:oligoendopeptidase F
MNYKGYNIAMHELGHNVEQVLSFNKVDYTLLRSVPNTAFTEGFAFVFQSRDMDILGFKQEDKNKDALDAINSLWMTYEISGVALVDMYTWRWMYKNQDATPAQLKDAVIQIAKDVWNQYYAPVFGQKDVILLAVYSHLIHSGLYVPDYPLGHIIAFQVEEYLKKGNLAKDMERMCVQGSITPNLWMEKAVGQPISTKPMLDAAERALAAIK